MPSRTPPLSRALPLQRAWRRERKDTTDCVESPGEAITRKAGESAVSPFAPALVRRQFFKRFYLLWLKNHSTSNILRSPKKVSTNQPYQRWTQGNELKVDGRSNAVRPPPANKLSAEERARVLAICHEPIYASLPQGSIKCAVSGGDRVSLWGYAYGTGYTVKIQDAAPTPL
jgi:hypothetical protein